MGQVDLAYAWTGAAAATAVALPSIAVGPGIATGTTPAAIHMQLPIRNVAAGESITATLSANTNAPVTTFTLVLTAVAGETTLTGLTFTSNLWQESVDKSSPTRWVVVAIASNPDVLPQPVGGVTDLIKVTWKVAQGAAPSSSAGVGCEVKLLSTVKDSQGVQGASVTFLDRDGWTTNGKGRLFLQPATRQLGMLAYLSQSRIVNTAALGGAAINSAITTSVVRPESAMGGCAAAMRQPQCSCHCLQAVQCMHANATPCSYSCIPLSFPPISWPSPCY